MALREAGFRPSRILPGLLLLLSSTTPAQVPKDVIEFERQNQQAWKETNAAGKPVPKTTHPGKKWADVFWSYRQKAGAAVATRATAEAIHLLVHAGRFDEVLAKSRSLPADDPAWKRVFDSLLEGAEQTKDYSPVIRISGDVLAKARDRETRATAGSVVGAGLWKSGRLNEAAEAFRQVIKIAPDSEQARSAERTIYEITHLQVGQTAPAFAAATLAGAAIDSARLRGKAVLLNFWASY